MKKEQNKQFKPTDDLLQNIFELYGLKYLSYKPATSGIENTTLIVETTDARYVLRVYRQDKKTTNDIQEEVGYTQYLRSNGIKVPEIIKNAKNNYITEFEQNSTIWQIILMEFIDGEHSHNYSRELLKEIARNQAKMHILSSKYRNNGGEELTELAEGYFIKQININQIQDDNLKQFLNRAENFKLILDKKLPKGLCHLDFDNDNIMSKDNKITAILDFDDLAVAPFVVCLGYTLWHVLYTDGLQKMHEYLAEYEKTRSLNNLEKSYLHKIIIFRHYVISSLKILNGHTTNKDTKMYLRLEEFINNKYTKLGS